MARGMRKLMLRKSRCPRSLLHRMMPRMRWMAMHNQHCRDMVAACELVCVIELAVGLMTHWLQCIHFLCEIQSISCIVCTRNRSLRLLMCSSLAPLFRTCKLVVESLKSLESRLRLVATSGLLHGHGALSLQAWWGASHERESWLAPAGRI